MTVSVIVSAFRSSTGSISPEGVVRTLAALVPSAVEGVIGDLALIGADSADLAAIAERAGCALRQGQEEGVILRAGLDAARRERAFVVKAGFIPGAGFAAELGNFAAGDGAAAVLRETLYGWRSVFLRGRIFGLAGEKAKLAGMAPASFEDLARGARAQRRFACGGVRCP